MFYIGFVSGKRIDSEGWHHAIGEITMGGDSAGFAADLHVWTMADYETQWREAVARFAAGNESSALITSYRGPGVGYHVMWPMWREGTTVLLQERLVIDEAITETNVSEALYARVGDRRTLSDDGDAISEWRVPFSHVLAFLVDE
jgi:hypothetical protein